MHPGYMLVMKYHRTNFPTVCSVLPHGFFQLLLPKRNEEYMKADLPRHPNRVKRASTSSSVSTGREKRSLSQEKRPLPLKEVKEAARLMVNTNCHVGLQLRGTSLFSLQLSLLQKTVASRRNASTVVLIHNQFATHFH